jgi:hypothetical protein
MARLMPIHGNLLHHAVEMYLKTALVGVVSLEDMKRKYVHNLKRLWRRFKEKEADPALNRFDSTIRALHAFENLRYPDTIPDAAIALSIAWDPSHSITLSGTAAKRTRKYEIVISDVDHLVIEIMKRAQLNPKYFVTTIGSSGRTALAYQNPRAADW